MSEAFNPSMCVHSISVATRAVRDYGCYYDGQSPKTMITASSSQFFLAGSSSILTVDIVSGKEVSSLPVFCSKMNNVCSPSATAVLCNVYSFTFSAADNSIYISADQFANNVQAPCFVRISSSGDVESLFWDDKPSFLLLSPAIANTPPAPLPVPTVSSVSPSSGSRSSGKLTVAVAGANFGAHASSLWGGTIPSPCTYSSPAVVFCSVPKSPVAGQALVQVSNDGFRFSTDKVFFTYTDAIDRED
eukprot:ANDGO_03355.mRNA.1 hypothetical protein